MPKMSEQLSASALLNLGMYEGERFFCNIYVSIALIVQFIVKINKKF